MIQNFCCVQDTSLLNPEPKMNDAFANDAIFPRMFSLELPKRRSLCHKDKPQPLQHDEGMKERKHGSPPLNEPKEP